MDQQLNQASAPMPRVLTVTPSPHVRRKGLKTSVIMVDVILALIPATVWGIIAFGFSAFLVVALATGSAVFFEWMMRKLMKRSMTISDCSAAVTGLLLGLNLSAAVPWYVPIVGSAFAIIVVKQLFGGIGRNIMNPALAARVFLMMCWPAAMSEYPAAFAKGVDVVAGATPLVSLKNGMMPDASLLDLFLGKTGGCIGEISALLLLVGGVYLIWRRVISWQIPLGMLGTVALLTFLFPQGDMGRVQFMVASLCSGGVMIGAIYMATDYVTSPVTTIGRVIYGIGCGLLVVFIRFFGGYPEGTSFAILIMNTMVWYLDMATKPRVYGKSRRKRGA